MFCLSDLINRLVQMFRDLKPIRHDGDGGDVLRLAVLGRLPPVHRHRCDVLFLVVRKRIPQSIRRFCVVSFDHTQHARPVDVRQLRDILRAA